MQIYANLYAHFQLEDAEWERERLVKRLSRVADRVEEEKQIINAHAKKTRNSRNGYYV